MRDKAYAQISLLSSYLKLSLVVLGKLAIAFLSGEWEWVSGHSASGGEEGGLGQSVRWRS